MATFIKTLIIAAIAVYAILSSGCTELKPAALRMEIGHTSHASQHWPFAKNPTNYGNDLVSVGARWQPTKNLSLVVTEGYCVDTTVDRMKEVFQARVAYEVPLE